MKILLHVCCAPCLIYPLESLREQNFQVCGFFYNPNIHPLSEYTKRRQATLELNNKDEVEIIYPEYLTSEFMSAIEHEKEAPGRCLLCWQLRIERTAQTARKRGFDAFTTTLLVSPYQDQQALKEIGTRAAAKYGVFFYYQDFRPGFREAHNQAKRQGIYCQNYCGCMYSEIERKKK